MRLNKATPLKYPWLASIFCLCFTSQCLAQFYLRGEIHDQHGNPLANVRITLYSKGDYPYYSGSSGGFGIPSGLAIDTIAISNDGFEALKIPVETSKFQSLVMKALGDNASVNQKHLLSLTKNKPTDNTPSFFDNGESYSSTVENTFIETNKYPETGFALNIDRASYSNIRRFINTEGTVPQDAVRIEEMLNYFDFRNLNIDSVNHSFSCNTHLTSVPWKTLANNQLLFVNLQAPKLVLDNISPSNFIFLIDVSGSMDDANKLPLLQSAFKMLVQNLRAEDTVAIVTYGGTVGIKLQPTSGADKQVIITAINQLSAGGETPGGAGIQMAYSLAERSFNIRANNRIILATDGDFNIGQTSEKELEDLISEHKRSGIYLTCLGVGMGNYKDSKLAALATKGNGNFAYIDNLEEAEKVLVTEFTKTLYAVADDAYLSIHFNEDLVKQYRLIGFDNKKDALNDNSSQLEGGEVGSGHSLMAVFEIIPTDKNKNNINNSSINQPVASLKLQYKIPHKNEDHVQEFQVPFNYKNIENADSSIRFAASVCMFGELLKQSDFAKDYTWNDLEKVASSSANLNDASQKECLELIEKASKVYLPPVKTKHKKKEENN